MKDSLLKVETLKAIKKKEKQRVSTNINKSLESQVFNTDKILIQLEKLKPQKSAFYRSSF